MTGEILLQALEDLQLYLRDFHCCFGRPEQRQLLLIFAKGQLSPIERKSLEPIADAEGINPRRLQFFFRSYDWDADGVRAILQRKVAEAFGGPEGIFIIDETSDTKKGRHTAGVARQYCGSVGKIDNGIVTVHTAYANQGLHALIDGELFLPESWNPDPNDPTVNERRRKAGIPEDARHVSKPDMSIEQLRRALENGVPGRWVTADENYGRWSAWRRAVTDLGLSYVVEIPRNTRLWTREPRLAVPGKRSKHRASGSEFEPAPRRADKVAVGALAPERGKPLLVHDTEKGPEVWRFQRKTVWAKGERPGELEGPLILLVAHNPLDGEVKYFLSNAPVRTPLAVLVRVGFSRWRVERCFQDSKEELGLDHAEMRSWKGIHRHLLLTAVVYLFLILWRRDGGKKRGGRSDGEPTGRRHPRTAGGSNRGST